MDREYLEQLVKSAEARLKDSYEASADFIHKHAHAVHHRAKELIDTGMDRTQAFQQAAKENSNVTYKVSD